MKTEKTLSNEILKQFKTGEQLNYFFRHLKTGY